MFSKYTTKIKSFFLVLLIIIFFLLFLFFVYENRNSSVLKPIKSFVPEKIKVFLYNNIFIFVDLKEKNKFNQEKIFKQYEEIQKLKKINDFLYLEISKGKLIEQKKIENYGYNNFNEIKKFSVVQTTLDNILDEKNIRKSFYLEKYDNKLLLNFENGNIFFIEDFSASNNELEIQEIESNAKNFLFQEGAKGYISNVRDSKIIQNYLYLSYVKRIQEECYNTSILRGEIKKDFINFEEFFTYPDCISTEITGAGSGGRIEQISNEEIIFSIGDQNNLHPAQDINSPFGKMFLININNNSNYRIVTMGHRNPQGIVISKLHDLIFSSEHGPEGGDEVNLIKISKEKVYNYGWAISSYGDHYHYRDEKIRENYPLYKSHSEHGFEEPLLYFTPAVAPTQLIIEYEDENFVKLVLATLKDKSLYFLDYNVSKNNLTITNKIVLDERIRDIIYYDEMILATLENTPSLAVLYNNKQN